MKNFVKIMETLLIGILGGFIFFQSNLPLPWVLGPMAFVMLWQVVSKRQMVWPDSFKNGGLLFLGIYFGLYFTTNTFITVGPYLLPYILVTGALILVSIVNSSFVTRWIKVDKITSAFGSIPGGLSEMVAASEALKARSSLVAIFQTVRLLTVLFLVPFFILHSFSSDQSINRGELFQSFAMEISWTYLLLIFPIIFGAYFRNILPAGIVIIPLVITALINVSIIELPPLPPLLLVAAQVTVGIGMGKKISLKDLKAGGKYSFVYFGLTLALITISFGLGALLAIFTSLDLPTALLSAAPGGLIEMVLTASMVGADPAIVSALQLVRILIIIVFVPPLLKWYFKKRQISNAA